jgi:putative transcriptional regulator
MKKRTNELNRLEIVLAELGMAHKELAAGVDVSVVTMSRYCNNKRQPTLEMLNAMANYMKVDVRRLIVPNKCAMEQGKK